MTSPTISLVQPIIRSSIFNKRCRICVQFTGLKSLEFGRWYSESNKVKHEDKWMRVDETSQTRRQLATLPILNASDPLQLRIHSTVPQIASFAEIDRDCAVRGASFLRRLFGRWKAFFLFSRWDLDYILFNSWGSDSNCMRWIWSLGLVFLFYGSTQRNGWSW